MVLCFSIFRAGYETFREEIHKRFWRQLIHGIFMPLALMLAFFVFTNALFGAKAHRSCDGG
jgi:putative copper export protein